MNDFDKKIGNLLCNLSDCQEVCIQTMLYCLEKEGEYSKKDNISLLIDCAEICKVSESFFLRESLYAGDFLDICSSICDDCASFLKEFRDDDIMQECALVCKDCRKACDEVIEESDEEGFEELEEDEFEES